jgi:hypothetical protein
VGRLAVGIDGGENELRGGAVVVRIPWGLGTGSERSFETGEQGECDLSTEFVPFPLADIWNLRVHTVVVHDAAAYFLRLLRSCVLFPHLESLGGHQHLNGARSVHGAEACREQSFKNNRKFQQQLHVQLEKNN